MGPKLLTNVEEHFHDLSKDHKLSVSQYTRVDGGSDCGGARDGAEHLLSLGNSVGANFETLPA